MGKYRFDEIAVNSTEKKKPEKADKHTYIGLEHLDPGRLQVTRYGSDVAPIGEKLIMRKGDVLFGKRRAYQKKVAIAPFDGIFSAHGMVLRPNEKVIDRDFFPFFISSDYFLDAAIAISVGSLSPTINWRDLKELEFILPNLDKQRKLAKILWAMEETKKSYRKLLQLSDELVKCQFVEMFGNPMRNDRGWPIKKIREVAPAIAYSGQIESIKGCYWLLNLDMVEAHTGRILDKVMVPREEIGVSTVKFSPENVLYSKLRPYLNKVSNPDGFGYVTTEMVPLLPDRGYINPIFLSALLRGNEFLSYIEKQVAGTKMPRVQMNVFWGLDLILPPLSLQEKYVSIIRQNEKYKFDLEQTLAELSATSRKLIAEEFG